MNPIPYKYLSPPAAMIIFPLFWRIGLQGTGHEGDLIRYLIPLFLGVIFGFLLGILGDLLSVQMLKMEENLMSKNAIEGKYEAVSTKSYIPILLLTPGHWQIREANPAAAHFYGHSIAKLCRMKITELDQHSPRKLVKALESIKPNSGKSFNTIHQHANGQILPVKLHISDITTGNQTEILVEIDDMTEITTLREILPICPVCEQERDGEELRKKTDQYIKKHPLLTTDFGVCPDCSGTKKHKT